MTHRVLRLLLALALLGLAVGCVHQAPPPSARFVGPAISARSTTPSEPATRASAPGTPFVRARADAPFDPRLVVTTQVAHGDLFMHGFGPEGPRYVAARRLYRGQHAYLLPFAANYGVAPDRRTDLTYELTIHRPDGDLDDRTLSAVLWQYPVSGPELILYPAATVAFHAEARDPLGDYCIIVRVTDHLAGETRELYHSLKLEDYRPPVLSADFNARTWFETYYLQPTPEFALPALDPLFTRLPADQRAAALPTLLGFYDQLLTDNPWLLPAFAQALSEADPDRAYSLSVVLGHHLRRADSPPPGLPFAAWVRLTDFRTHAWPSDPDATLARAAQLDTLWGRFFASGLYAPVAGVLATLGLHEDLGAADRWQQLRASSGADAVDLSPAALAELPEPDDSPDSPPAAVRRDILLRTALWSLRAQAHHHALVRSYLDWSLHVGALPPPQKLLLTRLLQTDPTPGTGPSASTR